MRICDLTNASERNTMYYEVMAMTISLRLTNEEAALMKTYAQMNGVTVSELVRKCVFEHIEDEYDLEAFHTAMKEYSADPVTYTLDEVEKELGLR